MDRDLRVVLSARVFSDQKCFGPGVSQLLKRVDELHSLRAAAMSLSMAYSKAWMVIRNAENGLGFHLLLSNTGGRNGGGAALTDEARPNFFLIFQSKNFLLQKTFLIFMIQTKG